MMHPSRSHEGTGSANQITLAFVLRSLGRWWKLATICGVSMAVGVSAVIWFSFTPVYRSTAMLQVQAVAPYIIYPSRDKVDSFMTTQTGILHSNFLLGRAIVRPEMANVGELNLQIEKEKWLAENIRIGSQRNSELFTIGFECGNARDSATIVDAIVKTYLETHYEDDSARRESVIKLLKKENESRKSKVERLRENVRELTRQVTGRDPDARVAVTDIERTMLSPLATLKQQLITAEVDLEVKEAQATVFEELLAERVVEIPDALIDSIVNANDQVQEKRDAIAAVQARMADIESRSVHGTRSPSYQRLAKQARQLSSALATFQEDLGRTARAERATSLTARRKQDLSAIHSQLDRLRMTRKLMQERYDTQIAALKQDVGASNSQLLELQFAKANLERENSVLDRIADRALSLQTEMRAPARITLREPAKVASLPVVAGPYKQIAAASLIALCAPFVLAVFWERIVRRINDSHQLSKESNLQVIGEIAALPTRANAMRNPGGRRRRELSLFEESIDGLRTCLVLSDNLGDMRVLAVTSAVSGEGKTSLSSQLALSIARSSGKPTLLIDADMRSPDIHRIFQIEQGPGLAQVLAGQCQCRDAIVSGWSKDFDILPAGKLEKSPHKLLGDGAFNKIIERLRTHYDYIIVDTPPVLSASEALVMANAADGTLLCTMRDTSRVRQVKMACDRLRSADAVTIGAVLAGVPTNQYAYRYGSYGYLQA